MVRPFSRPSIDLGGSGPRRAWKHVRAAQVSVGDTLAGHGTIARGFAGPEGMIVLWFDGPPEREQRFEADDVVHAFTVATD